MSEEIRKAFEEAENRIMLHANSGQDSIFMQFFKAGAESRQAEIDELTEQRDKLVEALKYECCFVDKTEQHIKLLIEIKGDPSK